MYQIDSKTIETLQRYNVSDHLPVVTHCAHPVFFKNGTLLNVGLGPSLTGMNYVLFEYPGRQIKKIKVNQGKELCILGSRVVTIGYRG